MTTVKPWRLHAQARKEVERAARHYDHERLGLGAEWIDDFDMGYAAVRRGPITARRDKSAAS